MTTKFDTVHLAAYQRLQELNSRQYRCRKDRLAAIAVAKAEELGRFVDPHEIVSFGEFDVEFVRWGHLPHSVEVLARVWRNGRQLGFGKDGMVDIERFRFNRVPMFVDDANGHHVKTWQNRHGKERQRGLRFAPLEALVKAITEAAVQDGKDSGLIVPGTIGSTTYTLFPPTNGSGSVISQNTSTYSTMRSGVNLSVTTELLLVGQDKSSSLYDNAEGFVAFDTSSVAGTISSATLSLYVNDTSGMTNTWTLNARDVFSQVATLTWLDCPTISTSDWISGASVSTQTLMASVSVSTSTTQSAYLTLTSQSAFNDGTRINQSGYTGLMLTSSRFEAGTVPTDLESIGFDSDSTDNVAGTGSDPKLVVVAAAPAASGNFFMLL